MDNSSIHILACVRILAELCWQRRRELTADRLGFEDSNSDHNKDSVHNGILALNEKYVDGATRTGYDLTKLARCIQDRRRDLKLVRKEELQWIHSTVQGSNYKQIYLQSRGAVGSW